MKAVRNMFLEKAAKTCAILAIAIVVSTAYSAAPKITLAQACSDGHASFGACMTDTSNDAYCSSVCGGNGTPTPPPAPSTSPTSGSVTPPPSGGSITPPPSPGGPSGNAGIPIINIPNPFKGGSTLYDFIKTVINDIILPLGGVIAVIALIYSGFLFVTAQGNEAQLKTAKQNFLYVCIGIAVLLGAWAIATAIQGTINQLTS